MVGRFSFFLSFPALFKPLTIEALTLFESAFYLFFSIIVHLFVFLVIRLLIHRFVFYLFIHLFTYLFINLYAYLFMPNSFSFLLPFIYVFLPFSLSSFLFPTGHSIISLPIFLLPLENQVTFSKFADLSL